MACRLLAAATAMLTMAATTTAKPNSAAVIAEMQQRRRPLLELIPRLSPRYMSPTHLGPLIDSLDRVEQERVRAVWSVPPRHGKTETILHWIARYLRRHPDRTIAYCTYAADLAQSKSRKARALAALHGVPLDPKAAAVHEWRTLAGGGLLATGIGGPLTGHGAHVLVVDDPIKNRREAESAIIRRVAWEWLTEVGLTRLEPGGSAFIVQTRWHPDDPAGRAIAGYDGTEVWPYLCLPALRPANDGTDLEVALWPERFSVEALRQIRRGMSAFSWTSLFQGAPRPRGGTVFGDATLYSRSELPAALRVVIGVDLAYTKRTSADWSVAVVLGLQGHGTGTRAWVLDMVRLQVRAPEFRSTLRALRRRYRGARFCAYVSGIERGVLDLLREPPADAPIGDRAPLRVEAMTAGTDKFVRAQDVAAAWNGGRVLVPADGGDWADDLVDEVTSFTGINDASDDIVDALASGWDGAASSGLATLKQAMQNARSAG